VDKNAAAGLCCVKTKCAVDRDTLESDNSKEQKVQHSRVKKRWIQRGRKKNVARSSTMFVRGYWGRGSLDVEGGSKAHCGEKVQVAPQALWNREWVEG